MLTKKTYRRAKKTPEVRGKVYLKPADNYLRVEDIYLKACDNYLWA